MQLKYIVNSINKMEISLWLIFNFNTNNIYLGGVMFNLKKYKSDDGYYLYEVKLDEKSYYLGDRYNYKKNIQNLIDNLEGLLFDSVVFIFGIDAGEYITELENKLCECNVVIIIEPNKEIYDIHKENMVNDNIHLILYDEEMIKSILKNTINYKNFNRLHVHCFGNYEQLYEQEYKKFIEILDNFSDQTNWFINLFVSNYHFKESIKDHLTIIEALEKNNEDLVVSTIIGHLNRVKKYILSEIDY